MPHTGCSHTHPAAKDFSIRPEMVKWSTELRNSLGVLKNVSSAGESARKYLRGSIGLVETLVWIVRSAVTGENVDEKVQHHKMHVLYVTWCCGEP